MEPQTQAASPAGAGIKTLAWIEVNKRLLLRAGVGALALIVIVAVFIQYQAGKEAEASRALSEVRIPFNPSVQTDPDTAEKLFKVANQHKGTKAAERALIMSAGVLFTDREFAKAQERFNTLLQQYPDSPWIADAHLGVAASLEAQGKTDDAIRKYEDLRKRYANVANAPIADDVKLALGRLYEKSDATNSFKLYEDLIKNHPNSAAASEASLFQDALVKKNPELAKLREPVVPPTPPPTQPPVQITRLTNQPAGSNRTISLSNLIQRAGTNAMNAVTSAAPPQIKAAPAGVQPAPVAPPK